MRRYPLVFPGAASWRTSWGGAGANDVQASLGRHMKTKAHVAEYGLAHEVAQAHANRDKGVSLRHYQMASQEQLHAALTNLLPDV